MLFSLSLLWSDFFCVVPRQLLWHTPQLVSVSLEASAKGTGPKFHFCSPGNLMHTASPACRGGRFFVPWLYCLQFNFLLAASSLTVAPESLHGWRSFVDIGSHVQVCLPVNLALVRCQISHLGYGTNPELPTVDLSHLLLLSVAVPNRFSLHFLLCHQIEDVVGLMFCDRTFTPWQTS